CFSDSTPPSSSSSVLPRLFHIQYQVQMIKHTSSTKSMHRPARDKESAEDNDCSRHMTGNISYLSDFEEINGGYVVFGGNLKGDTECVVLSSDFKLPDETHVLLRVPGENNTYNVDLKNIIPSEDLTCVFAKATLD
nr:ribonuclease H-like domain-containing protein [Tanacetum cinerariifolium]